MEKFLGTEDEYQTLYVEKKIFLNAFFDFLKTKSFFSLQTFINEAHQRKLVSGLKKKLFLFCYLVKMISYRRKFFQRIENFSEQFRGGF